MPKLPPPLCHVSGSSCLLHFYPFISLSPCLQPPESDTWTSNLVRVTTLGAHSRSVVVLLIHPDASAPCSPLLTRFPHLPWPNGPISHCRPSSRRVDRRFQHGEVVGHLYVLRRLPILLVLLLREPPLGSHASPLGDRAPLAGSLRITSRRSCTCDRATARLDAREMGRWLSPPEPSLR